MTNELKRARRQLARLQRRVEVLKCGRVHKLKTPLGLESQAMVRELSAQIKRKELEVRFRTALPDWYFWTTDDSTTAYNGTRQIDWCSGDHLQQAVNWAERQNGKAGGK